MTARRRAGFSQSDVLAIAGGGVVGASLRSWITAAHREAAGDWFEYAPNTAATFDDGLFAAFPTRTFIVNVLGCLILGALLALLSHAKPRVPRRLLIGAATGFCGSLTTFSLFAVEAARMLRGTPPLPRQPEGLLVRSEPIVGSALIYIALSVVVCGCAFAFGRLVGHRLEAPS